MDHDAMEAQLLAERYVLGQLSPAEAAAFEEHSLACPVCLDRLEAAEALRLGLRQEAAAAMETAPSGATTRPGGFAALAHLARKPRFALAAAALLAVALLPAMLLRYQLAAARGPQANALVVHLDAERSLPSEPASSVEILPPEPPGWVVLALELATPAASRYRVTLLDLDGHTLWRQHDIVPASAGSLTVLLPGELLRPGELRLRVEGEAAAAGPSRPPHSPVQTFAFRVRERDEAKPQGEDP